MSIKNFIPQVWAKQFEKEIDRNLVFKEDCNTSYEGTAKNVGDSVKILTPGKPTIRRFHDGKLHGLEEAEKVTGSSISLPLNEVADYNFAVGDLDKHQAEGNLKSVYMTEAATGVSCEIDNYIAAFANDKNIVKEAPTSALTKDAILGLINTCQTKLFQNDVSPNTTDIVLTASPKFIEILRDAYEKLDTNNSEMLKNGKVGMYHNITIKMSNNVLNDGTYDYIMMRTRKAIAFVNQVAHSEAYRPDKGWEDCIKGFNVFGGKVVRPKEIITLKVKY